MVSGLFHKDVYAPPMIFKSPGVLALHYSRHALLAAKNDRYGDLTPLLVPEIDLAKAEIVEVELVNGVVAKRVVRVHATENLVLVLAVNADGFVRTVWGNLHRDKHASLDTTKFVRRLPKFQWDALKELSGAD